MSVPLLSSFHSSPLSSSVSSSFISNLPDCTILYTDASGKGGYSFYFHDDENNSHFLGKGKCGESKFNTSHLLEIYAAYQGVLYCIDYINSSKNILLFTDCKLVQEVFSGKRNSKNPTVRIYYYHLKRILKENDVVLSIKLVKAHTGKQEFPYEGNDKVDKNAKYSNRLKRGSLFIYPLNESIK